MVYQKFPVSVICEDFITQDRDQNYYRRELHFKRDLIRSWILYGL